MKPATTHPTPQRVAVVSPSGGAAFHPARPWAAHSERLADALREWEAE